MRCIDYTRIMKSNGDEPPVAQFHSLEVDFSFAVTVLVRCSKTRGRATRRCCWRSKEDLRPRQRIAWVVFPVIPLVILYEAHLTAFDTSCTSRQRPGADMGPDSGHGVDGGSYLCRARCVLNEDIVGMRIG